MRKSKKIVLVLLALMLVGCTPIIPEENNNNNIIIEEPVEPIKLATNQNDLSNLAKDMKYGEDSFMRYPKNPNNLLINYEYSGLYSCDFSNELDTYYTCAYVDKSCEETLKRNTSVSQYAYMSLLGYNQYYYAYATIVKDHSDFSNDYPLTWYEISKDVEVPKEIDDKILIMIYVSKDLVFTDLKNPNNEPIIVKLYAEDVTIYVDSTFEDYDYNFSKRYYDLFCNFTTLTINIDAFKEYDAKKKEYVTKYYMENENLYLNTGIMSWAFFYGMTIVLWENVFPKENLDSYEICFNLNENNDLILFLDSRYLTSDDENYLNNDLMEKILELDYEIYEDKKDCYVYRFSVKELLEVIEEYIKTIE